MRLIVGLGNPGPRYEGTRHNAGFRAIELLAQKYSIEVTEKKPLYLFGRGQITGEPVILVKPMTFMNESGRAVTELMRYHVDKDFQLEHLIVAHDEIDFALGRIKVKKGGGEAGHNGVRSIVEHLGADFVRVRMGVGRPKFAGEDVADFVLKDFTREEQGKRDQLFVDTVGVLEDLVREGFAAVQRRPGVEPKE